MIEAIGKALWPVEGKFWGQSHWKPISLKKEYFKRDVYLKKSDDQTWKGRGFVKKLGEAGIDLDFDPKVKNLNSLDPHRIKVTLTWESKVEGLESAKTILAELGIQVKRKKDEPEKEIHVTMPAILDDSTLEKTGKAKAYRFDKENTPITLRGKAYALTPFIPAYLVGVIAYNLLRIIPVIIYLAARIIYDSIRSEETLGTIAKERVKQMGIQTGQSLLNVVRAPYYALGMQLGALCMIVDPFNGRKVIAAFEEEWNHGIPLSKSIWLCSPLQDYRFEGGGDPAKLGDHSFRMPGCFGALVEVEYDEEGVLRVTQCFAERRYLDTVGNEITIFTDEEIEQTKCCTCFPLCCQLA